MLQITVFTTKTFHAAILPRETGKLTGIVLTAVFPLVPVPLSITVEHGGGGGVDCLYSYNSACFCSRVCRDCFPRLQVTNLAQVHLQGKNVLNDYYLRTFSFCI